jgi:ABC-2 type transport system permease protein
VRAFAAFFKKEIMEYWRTYKLVIMLAVFALLGVMSPAIALLMPMIFENIDLGGLSLGVIPEPTALDAWAQFFKNVGQMGTLTLIIVCAGIMANEFSSGTLINLLTKGMSRSTVIMAKLLAACAVWTVSYLLCLATCSAYVWYYWDLSDMRFIAFFGMWLFGLLVIALLIFGGTLFKSFYGSLSLVGIALIFMTVMNVSTKMKKYNPISLAGETLMLLYGQGQPADFLPAVLISAACVLVLLAASIAVFNRKQV